jgi:tetratricopeptide (TPR) repeat protein
MRQSVFLSYSRTTSTVHAERLHAALGRELAFFDTSDIQFGAKFPQRLVDAILEARVVVLFVDNAYFRSWYCLRELELVLSPYLSRLANDSRDSTAIEAALSGVVVALPPRESRPADLANLPAPLRMTNWPLADDTHALEELVRARLNTTHLRLREIVGSRASFPEAFLEEAAIPQPKTLRGARTFPSTHPASLADGFVGRADELWRIHFALVTSRGDPSTSAPPTVVIEAPAGFGKTRLALEYFHRFGPATYSAGLFWVNAAVDDDGLEEQLHGILQTIVPDTPSLTAFRQAKRNVRLELTDAVRGISTTLPVLYVIDNVPEPDHGVAPRPLSHWCPPIGQLTVLVTSRIRLSVGEQGIESIVLGPLTSAAAVTLLSVSAIRSELKDAQWKSIADWVGGWPLGLELLARSMEAGALAAQELLTKATNVGPTAVLDEQMDVLRLLVPAGALRGASEALLTAFERLSPAAQQAARIVAQLKPGVAVPVAVFGALDAALGSPGVRAELLTRSFLTRVVGQHVPLVGHMHAVVADFLRSLTSPCADEVRWAVVAACEMFVGKADSASSWGARIAIADHAESLFERTSKYVDCDFHVMVVALGIYVGSYRGIVGLNILDKAGSLAFELEREFAIKLVLNAGNEFTQCLITDYRQDLGRSEQQLDQIATVQKLLVRFSLANCEFDEPRSVRAHSILATIEYMKRNFDDACALQERLLTVAESKVAQWDPTMMVALKHELALTYRALGKLEQARKLQQEVVDAISGDGGRRDPFGTAFELVSTLKLQGKEDEAITLQEKVLDFLTEDLVEVAARLGRPEVEAFLRVGLPLPKRDPSDWEKTQEGIDIVLNAFIDSLRNGDEAGLARCMTENFEVLRLPITLSVLMKSGRPTFGRHQLHSSSVLRPEHVATIDEREQRRLFDQVVGEGSVVAIAHLRELNKADQVVGEGSVAAIAHLPELDKAQGPSVGLVVNTCASESPRISRIFDPVPFRLWARETFTKIPQEFIQKLREFDQGARTLKP